MLTWRRDGTCGRLACKRITVSDSPVTLSTLTCSTIPMRCPSTVSVVGPVATGFIAENFLKRLEVEKGINHYFRQRLRFDGDRLAKNALRIDHPTRISRSHHVDMLALSCVEQRGRKLRDRTIDQRATREPAKCEDHQALG